MRSGMAKGNMERAASGETFVFRRPTIGVLTPVAALGAAFIILLTASPLLNLFVAALAAGSRGLSSLLSGSVPTLLAKTLLLATLATLWALLTARCWWKLRTGSDLQLFF